MDKELYLLKRKLLRLSSLVEKMVQDAMSSVAHSDYELAQSVIERDHEIDLMEVTVEEDCLKLLALHQPVATDLRFVVGVLKMVNDLERVGDLSVNIAERVLFLSKYKSISIPFDFETMAELTKSMLQDSLVSFIRLDAALAKSVCEADSQVDEINKQMYSTVFKLLREKPKQVERLIQYLSVSRYLERIADLATNIAEDVIYMVDGEIIRHKPEEGQTNFRDS